MRLIARFDALGMECVPWSVPEIGVSRRPGARPHRFVKQPPRMKEWLAFVNDAAKRAMSRSGLTVNPVFVHLTFFRQTPPGHRHGELWTIPVEWNEDLNKFTKRGKSSPDILNLFKGTEDALENVIYGNDCQTCIM